MKKRKFKLEKEEIQKEIHKLNDKPSQHSDIPTKIIKSNLVTFCT